MYLCEKYLIMPTTSTVHTDGHQYTAAIIDDNAGAINRLSNLLASYGNVKVIVTATGYASAIESLSSCPADLIFIDIDLPDGDGLELPTELRRLPGMGTAYMIIYTAFYQRSSAKGRVFDDGVDDYLLKPIDPEALDLCMQRFFFSRRKRSQSRGLNALTLPSEDNRVLVVMTTTTSEMRVIKVRDIGYFHYNSRRKVWEAVLTDNTIVQLKKTSSASDILSYSPSFLQTHQSYIVNFDYVMLIGKQKINLYPPFDKDEVLVGRTYLRALQAKFMCL